MRAPFSARKGGLPGVVARFVVCLMKKIRRRLIICLFYFIYRDLSGTAHLLLLVREHDLCFLNFPCIL